MLGLSQSDYWCICYFKGTAFTDAQGHACGVLIALKSAFGPMRTLSVLEKVEILTNKITLQSN